MKTLHFFNIFILTAFSWAGLNCVALAEDIDANWAQISDKHPDLVHIEVGGKASTDDNDNMGSPSPSFKASIESKDGSYDATIFQEGNFRPGRVQDLVRNRDYASGITYVYHSRTIHGISGGASIIIGPLAQKMVIQGLAASSNGFELRPEIGKFSSYNYDIRNRKYGGVTASLARAISDTDKVLVALQAGAYTPGEGTNHDGGYIGSARLEYRKNLGEHTYVGLQGVYERIKKQPAFNPSFQGVSSEAKIGAFFGTSFK